MAFPSDSALKNILAMQEPQERWVQFLVWKISWRKAWQLTSVFLPGEPHGQRSLVGYSPRGHKESDITEVTEHAVIEMICLNNFYISTVYKRKTLKTV